MTSRFRACATTPNVPSGATIHDTIRVRENNLFIESAVLQGTQLIDMPASLIMTPSSARDDLSGIDLDAFPDAAVMAAAILLRKSRGELDWLSLSTDGVADWNATELDLLCGTSVHEKATDIIRGVEKEHSELCRALGEKEWIRDLSAYKQAVAAIDACAVYVSESLPLVLCPVVCLTGRSSTVLKANAKVSYVKPFGNFLFKKEPKLTMSSFTEIESGSMVRVGASDDPVSDSDYFIQYGSLPREESIEMYGTELEFEISSFDPNLKDKQEILGKIEMSNVQIFNISLPSSPVSKNVTDIDTNELIQWIPTPEMDGFLRLCCLSGADSFLLERVFKQNVWDFMQLPVSKENERAMCDTVIGAVDDALDAMKDLESVDMDNVKESRASLARRIVKGERLVLEKVKLHYQQVLESVDVLEYYAERRLKALDLLRPLDESDYANSESGAQVGRAFDDNYV